MAPWTSYFVSHAISTSTHTQTLSVRVFLKEAHIENHVDLFFSRAIELLIFFKETKIPNTKLLISL
jgi:hypothetical protein